MREELLKAGIITEQRAKAIENLSKKKEQDKKKKEDSESEIHKYKFLDEKFKKKIRIVNKNKDGVIISNGVAQMDLPWKEIKESFHIIDKIFLIPNLKQQQQLLDVDKKMKWFQDRFLLLINLYTAHRTGKKDKIELKDMAAMTHLLEDYQKEYNCAPVDFIQALKDYFQYLDQMLHYSSLRWEKKGWV